MVLTNDTPVHGTRYSPLVHEAHHDVQQNIDEVVPQWRKAVQHVVEAEGEHA